MTRSDTPGTVDDSDACWRALASRDARFDGRFFTAVTSTGVYCRPVCAVRTPRRENCRFFTHAAQAERAGFRPCLRCRPELAPLRQVLEPSSPQTAPFTTQDASAILAQQAARLLDAPDHWADGGPDMGTLAAREPAIAGLAARLGISDRHLRRIFEAQFGVSPLQYLQTRRLLAAKQLLADTALPVAQVALAAGFASVRRFNAAFLQHYGLAPGALRRAALPPEGQGASVRLAYRPPYDHAALLAFFAGRRIPGLEQFDAATGTLRRTLALRGHAGWLAVRFDAAAPRVLLTVADSLLPVLPAVLHRVRAWLDLDADPDAIDAVLAPAFPGDAGLRVPGAPDGFELAVRAVLGQQITVAAARTLGERLVRAFGTPLATPFDGLDALFPAPAALAAADPDALGALGIVRQRQAAIRALAEAVDAGRIALHPGADVAATTAALVALPGIGDWTAQYIAMRALRWPDAFPAGDIALQRALGVPKGTPPAQAARAAEAASQAWRPWRSYAVLRAWRTLAPAAPAAGPAGQTLPKP